MHRHRSARYFEIFDLFLIFAVMGVLNASSARASDHSSGQLFSATAADGLDQTINDLMKTDNLPSVAVDVAVPGKGSYVFVSGVADLQTGAKRNSRQPFRIASLTKTFVATAVLQLVDRGKLRKNDVLAKWYPDFPNADKITVDDLLRMRSGIAAPSDEQLTDAVYDDPTQPAPGLGEMMAESAALARAFKAPDQEGVYTNLNYNILGGIVQRITGKDVGIFITKNIIRPLGLRQTTYPTYFGLPGGLHGYGLDPQTQEFSDKTAFNPALGGAAGAMISSLTDLRRYVRVLCVGGLLEPKTQQARLQGLVLAGTATEYGEGLISGPNACGHSGTVPGFSTDMYYFTAIDATVIVSVNRLDRDDVLRSESVLAAVAKALIAQFGAL